MIGESEGEPSGHGRLRPATVAGWTLLVTVAAFVVAVVTLLAGITGFNWHPLGIGLQHGAGSATTLAETGSASGPPFVATGPPTGLPPGSCLRDEGRVTPCDVAHDAEVIRSSDRCTPSDIIAYLGGTPGVDVLGATVGSRDIDVDGTGTCVVTFAQPRHGRAKNALAAHRGADLRLCLDSAGREVGCGVRHRSEVVYLSPKGDTSDLDCAARAETYMQISPGQVDADVDLTGTFVSDRRACLVSARGHNVLTGSIRDIGPKALPLDPES